MMKQPLLESSSSSSSSDECNNNIGGGIWRKLTMSWLNPLFKKGKLNKLQLEDVPPIPPSEAADEAYASLSRRIATSTSFSYAILRTISTPLLVNAILAALNTSASYVGPTLITRFVNILSSRDDDQKWRDGAVLASIFFAANTVESLSQRHCYLGARRIGIRLKAALLALIYERTLLPRNDNTSGEIINCVNVDVERIGDFFWYFHSIWLFPVQIAFALAILYTNLGAAPSVCALFTTVLVMLTNIPLANVQKGLHAKIMSAKDSRMKATSETLKSIKVLKLHAWESSFLTKLLRLRNVERNCIHKYLYTNSAVVFLFWASPMLVSVVTFGVCVVLGTPLTTGTVLSALATFRILQEPIYNLPELISIIAQTKVSLDRIQTTFAVDGHRTTTITTTTTTTSGSSDCSNAVEIEEGEYGWDDNRAVLTITDRLGIKKGSKVGVCGSVGCGKTSLLLSILGEIPRVSGVAMKSYGSVALVPQSAWIQSGTVRDNVLFGKGMESEWYERVVEACALKHDFERWSGGDLCVVGERGVNLSGGQKQRIQMARALYSNSDVYLLDDPFSHVDANTGTHMFQKCLVQLLRDKTVVYVTHQLEFLVDADLVLVMKDGRIVESGTYEDLISNPNGELSRQMDTKYSMTHHNSNYSSMDSAANKRETQEEVEFVDDLCRISKEDEEEKAESSGSVMKKWHVYTSFITSAYKGGLVPVVILCHVIFQGLQMASSYWMAWGSSQEAVKRKQLILIFGLLSLGSSLFVLARAVVLSAIAIRTAQRLFLDMITSVFRAPLSFFDSTPSSTILNRSSTDQSTVDTDIPYRLAGLAFALIQLFSIVILMSHLAYQVFFLFLIVFALSLWYQSYYISTARELARLVPIQQAPIIQHLSESITGATVIRTFNQEQRFRKNNLHLINNYSRVAFYNFGTTEWLCVRINFLFNLVFFLVLVILVSLPNSTIEPSLAGLAATYGLSLNVLQSWVIWNLCSVQNKMISVERILEMSTIPTEAALVIQDHRPDQEWPQTGTIQFDNLHMQYTPYLPMVLKGISCIFSGKNKVGIVGRTGSGKSTLVQALFRVVEPSHGRILIDGLDISKIGLQDLRSRLSILPQDPVLFQGTLRTNLDTLAEHSDQEIWEVLRKCHLVEKVRQDERLLDAPVAEDGENWSLGERQLVCLGRVLLQRRRIVVLDEATASVDTQTDQLIHSTIRKETNGCTVITVAHRIPTVLDNDLVLVLDQGKILEYDCPAHLLQDGNSEFSNLAKSSGYACFPSSTTHCFSQT